MSISPCRSMLCMQEQLSPFLRGSLCLAFVHLGAQKVLATRWGEAEAQPNPGGPPAGRRCKSSLGWSHDNSIEQLTRWSRCTQDVLSNNTLEAPKWTTASLLQAVFGSGLGFWICLYLAMRQHEPFGLNNEKPSLRSSSSSSKSKQRRNLLSPTETHQRVEWSFCLR
jgi:hypothetical protein